MPPRARPGHIRPRNALTSSISSRRPLTEYTASRARVSAGGNPPASVHSRGILIDVPSLSRTSRRLPRSVKTSSCCPSRGWCRRITVIWGGENRRWYAVRDSVPSAEQTTIAEPVDDVIDKAAPKPVRPLETLLPYPLCPLIEAVDELIEGGRLRVARSVEACSATVCRQGMPSLLQRGRVPAACNRRG